METKHFHLLEALKLAWSDSPENAPPVQSRYKHVPARLKRALALSQSESQLKHEPIRTLHHLSCTGGTLITKCIAAMANVLVLNEIDLQSPMTPAARNDPTFTPSDIVSLLKQGDPHISDQIVANLFQSNLRILKRELWTTGRSLVLRDHSHSHFLAGDGIPQRDTLLKTVKQVAPVRALVTVRHPVHSYASLQIHGWDKDFRPSNYDEYCRRYLAFLDAHQDIPIIKYEDFVHAPKAVMKKICQLLDLTYYPDFQSVYGSFKFTGDSGRRRNDRIVEHPARPVSDELRDEVTKSSHHEQLLFKLDYPTSNE